MPRGLLFALLALALPALVPLTATADDESSAVAIGSRRELFVDRHLVESIAGARLELGRLCDEGPVLAFDKPWEGLFSGYVTVIRDGERLRLYYRGHADDSADGSPSEVTCYAESTDGVHWTKPDLGLFTVHGTRDNNVVLADAAPVTHNFCPFLDANPNASPTERYKAVGGTADSGLVGYVSADGLHWSRLQDEPVFRDKGWVFDSQNVPFWSENEGCYVLYYRRAAGKKRSIARTTSTDFRTWSEPVPMRFSDTGSDVPSAELYTNQTQPYFRAPHLYVATAARFMKGRQVISDAEAEAIGVHPNYFGDTSDAVLMTSRGGDLYDRTFLDGFLRPGIGAKNWVSRTNYPALNVVQTGPHEMSLYVNQDYGQPTAHLRRYSLRLDGFASLRASSTGGSLVTKPIVFDGRVLSVNFATSAAGGVRIEIQNADGTPVPGFALDDCRELVGNEIERSVSWKSGTDVSSLAGRPVRLRIVLNDADVYAFRFHDEHP